VRKKQRRMTFSLKSSFNLTRKRSFEMTNLKKESSSKSKVKLDAISEQRRQENSIESLCR